MRPGDPEVGGALHVSLRILFEQPDIVRPRHVGGVHPVQLQPPLLEGAVPVNLGQAVDGEEHLKQELVS